MWFAERQLLSESPVKTIMSKILVFCALVLTTVALPAPRPKPISVYQQEDHGQDEQQQYQQLPQQQLQYRPAPAAIQYKQLQGQPLKRPAGRPGGAPQGLEPQSEDYEEPPQPYNFSFDVNDDENTNYQNRKEQREGNKISGSYSVVDSDGFIRTVTYTADPVEGFKAHVSREPTNIVVKIPEQVPTASFPQSPAKPIQHNGAALRPAAPANARRQQTQQYLQAAQDEYPGQYQGQGSVRVSQAVAQGGQLNQYLSQTSPQASQISQFSSSSTGLRG